MTRIITKANSYTKTLVVVHGAKRYGHTSHMWLAKESVVLAKWLMGICLAVALKYDTDEHAQMLGSTCFAFDLRYQHNFELNIKHWGSELSCAEVEGCGLCQLSCNEKFYERSTWAAAFSKQPFPFTGSFSCIWCLAIPFPLINEPVFFFLDCIQNVSKEACYLYHSALNALATEAIQQGKCLWKVRPKLHKLPSSTSYYQASVYACMNAILNSLRTLCFGSRWPRLNHICYDQAWRMHPLWIACYADEDMVGKIKSMAVEAMPRQMARQVLRRYVAYVCIRWYRQLLGVWNMFLWTKP